MQEQTIFDATRPNPFLKCHLVGASNIFLVNSKPLRHKVLSLNSGQYESKLELPLKYVFARRPVCFVMLQLSVMKDAHFKFELKLLTYQKKLHFLTFSTECEQIKETVQVTWIPLSLLIRSRWVNLSINLQMMLSELRSTGAAYSLESITVYASCQLSRIAICRNQYQDTSHLLSGNNDDILIVTQVLDLAKIRISQWKHCTSSNTEELHILVAGKENEGDQIGKKKFKPVLLIRPDPARSKPIQQIHSASYKSRGYGDIFQSKIESGTQPNTRCFSASSSLGRAKATQHRRTGERSPASPSITISPSDEHTGRTGNLYLFNSLPQPTPTHAWTKLDNGTKEDKQSPFWNLENALSPLVPGVERVSVDRQAIREITTEELELKAALAGVPSPRTPDTPFKSPKLLSPLVIGTKLLGNAPNIGNSKSPSPRPSPVTDKLSSIAAPLDLDEYVQSDDLSASFEASLLASLKEAAAGVACQQSGLELCMESNGIANAFTMTVGKKPAEVSERQQGCPAELRPRLKIPPRHSKRGSIGNSPIPQTPENLQLRKLIENEFQTDMSYSDDDTSMATTTAGLGSLLDSPFPENYVEGNKKEYPGFPSRKSSFNPETKLGAQLLYTDDISVHPSHPPNRRHHADEGPSSSTASSSCWQLHSASSEPNLVSVSVGPVCLPNNPLLPELTYSAPTNNSSPTYPGGVESPDKCIQDTVLELLYDAVLDCYYDPSSGVYYELA
ncbi:hypothetical protein CRM22_011012 [Opisthorchis felineus]|uniref:CFA20 domain-containing protein n=1 Tax=Opisthorchis felineus TaxID=147828 RepID=A0A4S2KEM6_OPIFE|nr:hypothetical protein CRM22_011012 [Opisthorchis felineus]